MMQLYSASMANDGRMVKVKCSDCRLSFMNLFCFLLELMKQFAEFRVLLTLRGQCLVEQPADLLDYGGPGK